MSGRGARCGGGSGASCCHLHAMLQVDLTGRSLGACAAGHPAALLTSHHLPPPLGRPPPCSPAHLARLAPHVIQQRQVLSTQAAQAGDVAAVAQRHAVQLLSLHLQRQAQGKRGGQAGDVAAVAQLLSPPPRCSRAHRCQRLPTTTAAQSAPAEARWVMRPREAGPHLVAFEGGWAPPGPI